MNAHHADNFQKLFNGELLQRLTSYFSLVLTTQAFTKFSYDMSPYTGAQLLEYER